MYIQVRETWWQSGVRSCIMPGLPKHLVEELDVGTVACTSGEKASVVGEDLLIPHLHTNTVHMENESRPFNARSSKHQRTKCTLKTIDDKKVPCNLDKTDNLIDLYSLVGFTKAMKSV